MDTSALYRGDRLAGSSIIDGATSRLLEWVISIRDWSVSVPMFASCNFRLV